MRVGMHALKLVAAGDVDHRARFVVTRLSVRAPNQARVLHARMRALECAHRYNRRLFFARSNWIDDPGDEPTIIAQIHFFTPTGKVQMAF